MRIFKNFFIILFGVFFLINAYVLKYYFFDKEKVPPLWLENTPVKIPLILEHTIQDCGCHVEIYNGKENKREQAECLFWCYVEKYPGEIKFQIIASLIIGLSALLGLFLRTENF